VVTSGTLAPTYRASLDPERAGVAGVCRVLGQEFPSISCVQLDLPVGEMSPEHTVDLLLDGLASPQEHAELAAGDDRWWARTFQPTDAFSGAHPRVRTGGRYIISGGLGRIGRTLAAALGVDGPVHLLLLARSVPTRESTEIEALRRAGSTVDIRQVDVSDPQQVAGAVDRFIAEHGGVDGVVHAAGVTGPAAHAAIGAIAPGDLDAQHRAKVRGAENLRVALEGQRLDFAILCSSIASVLGGLEFATYAAANASLDAFAHRWWSPRQPWCSVGWEAWDFPSSGQQPLGAAVRDLALTPGEGAQVFRLLLDGARVPQVVVSAGPLAARIDTWRSPDMTMRGSRGAHERPALQTPYVAPSTADEVTVCDVWSEVLGLERVGVNDNFFELGGTSLLGLQIVHRLRRTCGVSLPLTSTYEGPTVRALARLVAGLREEPE
jgi:hypothetical protein